MHKSKLKRVSIAVCMALMPISIFAAGLGKLTVSSGLGEPLRADIELISVTPEELSSLSATIANEEAYATQGIDRPAMHSNIQIAVAKNASGTPVLKLKTNQAVNDPFLDMLIQVDWASGRLLREYTVLLDPPGYTGQVDKSNVNQPIQAPVTNSSANTASQTMVASQSSSAKMAGSSSMKDGVNTRTKKSGKKTKVRREERAEEMSADAEAKQDAYTTKRGDTLSSVAKQLQVDGVSLDQMLVGLYEANPKAFAGDNMNRLKAGKIIRVPSSENLIALSQPQAHAEVKLQSENWNAYRNKLADMVASTTPTAEDTSKESTGGKVTTAAEDKAAAVKTGPKDVVKLSSGDMAKSNASSSASAKAAEAKIAMQEDAIAKEKAMKDEQEKAAALAKIQQTKDLLALKSKQMADLQQQAKDNSAKPSVAMPEPVSPVPAKPAEPAKDEMAKAEPTSPTSTTPTAPVAVPATEKPAVAAAPKVDKPKSAPVVAAPASASFFDEILSGIDTTMLSIGGGALALLGGGWLFLRNKRKRNLADFEQGILTSGGLKANTVFGNTSGGKVDTGDTSFLTDFSQSTSGSMIDTNDVDPIAEAEVYMAYGREAQAEEILKDAIVKESKRYELHLKLLEMYAGRKDTAAYETIAGELYTTLGAGDPIWAKVAAMGATIEPDNPLYQSDSLAAAPSVPMQQTAKLNASDFSDIGEIEPDTTASSASNSSRFDFDLGSLDGDADIKESVFDETRTDQPEVGLHDTASASTYKPIEDLGMDFNLADLGGVPEAPISEHIADEERFGHTLPGFTMPELEPVKAVVDASATDMDFGLPSFELNNSSSKELEAHDLDFNFTTPEISQHFSNAIDLDLGESDKVEAKALDFSGISFDLGEPDTSSHLFETKASEMPSLDMPTAEVATVTQDAPFGDDPADVETKLDLVSAYLEMDDSEGAKELLEEVLKEGNGRQIAKAKELLANIV